MGAISGFTNYGSKGGAYDGWKNSGYFPMRQQQQQRPYPRKYVMDKTCPVNFKLPEYIPIDQDARTLNINIICTIMGWKLPAYLTIKALLTTKMNFFSPHTAITQLTNIPWQFLRPKWSGVLLPTLACMKKKRGSHIISKLVIVYQTTKYLSPFL